MCSDFSNQRDAVFVVNITNSDDYVLNAYSGLVGIKTNLSYNTYKTDIDLCCSNDSMLIIDKSLVRPNSLQEWQVLNFNKEIFWNSVWS